MSSEESFRGVKAGQFFHLNTENSHNKDLNKRYVWLVTEDTSKTDKVKRFPYDPSKSRNIHETLNHSDFLPFQIVACSNLDTL